ncbi:MAG: triple tyrosine motif-containing protein [Ignavibacteriales bacterium]|nr:triple tyrosine motif-containing protein [Ignavibacteriales bacterium]
MRFDYLTARDGLSDNRIWCIFRDSKEYLWVGTDAGLDKYDSYQFIRYRHDDQQPETISNNYVKCIYEDREKNLWFGTLDGLNLYDPAKDNFKGFKNNSTDTTSINGNYIASIIQDKKGNLWILTDADCLNKWIPATQSFVRYPFESKKEALSFPSKMMAFDSKGYLWVVSLSRGIRRFDPESGKFKKYDDPSINFGTICYKSVYIDHQDKIWITTDASGFISYDPAANTFEQFRSQKNGKGPNQDLILYIVPEDDRHLLLAVDQGGINRFDKVSKTFEYIVHDETNDHSLNNDGIWCFHRDREGILWVGTSGGGINYYNPKKKNFKVFTHNSNSSRSLSYNFTGCFYEDHQGLIWIGTDGGGVNVYNPKTGIFTAHKNDPSNPYSLSGNIIRCIAEDKDHDMWISTWDAGLNRYDRKTGRFFRYLPQKNNPSSISGRTIWHFTIDHENILWLGVLQGGIDLFDKKIGVVKRFKPGHANPQAISSDKIWQCVEDAEKNMWICTSDGLNRYDKKTHSFKVYNFRDNDIQAFWRDRDGNLWVGSNTSGIYYCKPDGTIIKTFTMVDGLPNNQIKAIIGDNNGNLWISTNYGISRLDRKTQKVRNYSKGDGLVANEFLEQSFLKTRRGEIYFGGYDGFNSFYPDSLKDNDLVPPVYVTDFQIFNKPVVYGGPSSQFQTHISEAKEIKLTWDQSVFSFSFNAINYTYPEKNQYAYIMEGFEKEWNYTNAARRYVTYTNLDPGEYTFKVKASNNDGIWNTEGTSLRIDIIPPFWQTSWFYSLCAVSLIMFGTSAYLFKVHQLRANERKLRHMVDERTQELASEIAERERLITKLQDAAADIKVLSGLVPICSNCKKIRDDKGYWTQLEGYIQAHSQAQFSHGVCPECAEKLYGDLYAKVKKQIDAASAKPPLSDSSKE